MSKTAPSYPARDKELHTLVLRGDNYIYFGNQKIAKVKYQPGRVKKWYAVSVIGTYTGRHTESFEDKRQVLMAVWYHTWLEPLF